MLCTILWTISMLSIKEVDILGLLLQQKRNEGKNRDKAAAGCFCPICPYFEKIYQIFIKIDETVVFF